MNGRGAAGAGIFITIPNKLLAIFDSSVITEANINGRQLMKEIGPARYMFFSMNSQPMVCLRMTMFTCQGSFNICRQPCWILSSILPATLQPIESTGNLTIMLRDI